MLERASCLKLARGELPLSGKVGSGSMSVVILDDFGGLSPSSRI